jgi:ribosomal protein S27AE
MEEQERRLERLEGHLRALDLGGSPCPRCDNGEILHDGDRLHCPNCGYAHSL